MKEEADKLGLRSKHRVNTKGVKSGGQLMSRGQIHHILSNPIYAGRIRHKKVLYEGRHTALIDPTVWEEVQSLLQQKAAYARGKSTQANHSSLLIGKLFDETGDRLTPSHTNKKGKRIRYYISHRLIKNSGVRDITGWRLPAQQLEGRLARSVLDSLKKSIACDVLLKPTVEEINAAHTLLNQMDGDLETSLSIIEHAHIELGQVKAVLNPDQLCALLLVERPRINMEGLTLKLPFQIRKRGVETKLIIGHVEPEKDITLIRNIAKAHKWFKMIKSGMGFDAIAKLENISTRRVQQVTEFAFLTPDIVDMILEGRQPYKLTSEWLLRNRLPSDWTTQRNLIASLS